MKHRITRTSKILRHCVFVLQWAALLGFVYFGILGWWFISLISLALSFGFHVLIKVMRHKTKEKFIRWLKHLPDPMDVLKKLGFNRRDRRATARKLENKKFKSP